MSANSAENFKMALVNSSRDAADSFRMVVDAVETNTVPRVAENRPQME